MPENDVPFGHFGISLGIGYWLLEILGVGYITKNPAISGAWF
jgi:hypothetical protein